MALSEISTKSLIRFIESYEKMALSEETLDGQPLSASELAEIYRQLDKMKEELKKR